jgi:hypothetical protein
MTIPVTTTSTSPRERRWYLIVSAWLRELAPYAVIELVLPGGSLMALALWWYRRHRGTRVCAAPNQCSRIGWMPQS